MSMASHPRTFGALFPLLIIVGLPLLLSAPARAYDDSWFRNSFWSGEWPYGFTVSSPVTVQLRDKPDTTAGKHIACELKKGATYHQWNQKRVLGDQLEFVSFTKIETWALTRNYKTGVRRMRDDKEVEISFKEGDQWSFLAYLSEGHFLLRRNRVNYVAYQDLITNSKRILPKGDEGASEYHEWLKLTCAPGVAGWLFVDEIKTLPGITEMHGDGYGKASDAPPTDAPTPSPPSDNRKDHRGRPDHREHVGSGRAR